MTLPDEIFINPRAPTDIQFGKSIITSLSGSNGTVTGSYIKTERTGEMTHYATSASMNEWPLVNYKCYPSGFLQTDKNINIIPVSSVYNVNDTFAVDVNNIDSYGNNLTNVTTINNLPTLPIENPPSVTLPAFNNYCEIQLDLPDNYMLSHFEFMLNVAPGSEVDYLLSVASDGISWNQITEPTAPDYQFDTDPVNTYRIVIKLTTPIEAKNIRFRVFNSDFFGGTSATVKFNHIFFAGEPM